MEESCLPAQIYVLVMCAVILFDLYLGLYHYAASNTISLLIGTLLLWVLCAANMSFVAYSLMILPVLFFLFLFAIILYDKTLFNIQRVQEQEQQQGQDVYTCDEQCEST